MNALEIQGLSKSFSGFMLHDVSFSIPMGTITGLVGRNGAGKTTTMKSILGVIRPDAGQISICGEPLSAEARRHVGLVYDECSFGDLRLKELSKIFGGIYLDWSEELFFGLCEKYALPANKSFTTFSRGMKKKLALAAALGHDPKVLLLDEPTAGLDPLAREELLDDLQEFIEDGAHAVLLSSHITGDLDRIADQILFIDDGRVLLREDKDTLLEEYCILKGAPDQLALLQAGDALGIRRHPHSFEALCRDAQRMKERYPQLVCDRADIASIFVILIGGEQE